MLKHAYLNLADVIVLISNDIPLASTLRMCRDEMQRTIYIVSDQTASSPLSTCGNTIWLQDMLQSISTPSRGTYCFLCGKTQMNADDLM
jgi:hypothetical protein